ncbi:thioesterase domain-containing protein [Micromonospora wenchangensis]
MPLADAADLRWKRQSRAVLKAMEGMFDVVLPLREGGPGATLFCVPPVGGLSWGFHQLLTALPPDCNVYGLQSRGLTRPEPLPTSMAELARDFADQVCRVQPQGPYFLLGWSVGGNVAYSMARELEARGHEVGLLASMDASPSFDPASFDAEPDAWFYYNIVLDSFGYPALLRQGDPEPEASALALIRRRPNLVLSTWSDDEIRRLLQVIVNNVAIARADVRPPGMLRCPVLLFAATGTEQEPSTAEKTESWRAVTHGPVEVIELDCKHQHMLLPEPMAIIGAALTRRLSAASRAASPSPAEP